MKGEYSWTAPNGEEYGVKYVADAGGFRVLETDAVATFRDSGLPADGECSLAFCVLQYEVKKDKLSFF